jgi:hypothetical protein
MTDPFSGLAVLLALVGRVVFAFADPTITESSGLVDLGSTMVTMNDSGGAPVLYTVDARTGRTVGRTTYADAVQDVEALAPGSGEVVWAADIGDNSEQRSSVYVYRVPVGRGDRRVDAASYELVYPDGPHDAESLVVHDGRLYLITKGLLGGTAYVAPRHLDPDRPNRLRPVAPVDIWATDAALLPDGRHVLVRGYDSADILTFPGFRPVASVQLPDQEQGEGVSIARSGRIRLSSEGVHSRVLQIELPDAIRAAVGGTTPTAAPTSTSPRVQKPVTTDHSPEGSSPFRPALVGAGGIVVVLAGLLVWARRRRRRG